MDNSVNKRLPINFKIVFEHNEPHRWKNGKWGILLPKARESKLTEHYYLKLVRVNEEYYYFLGLEHQLYPQHS